MAPVSRFFQAEISATFLRSAALAIALFMSTSLARAEVVTLVCQNSEGGGDSMTIRVDYDKKLVHSLRSDGTEAYSAAATITEGAVEWNAALRSTGQPWDDADPRFRGYLNRLSGQGHVVIPRNYKRSNESPWIGVSGPCRRATQKF